MYVANLYASSLRITFGFDAEAFLVQGLEEGESCHLDTDGSPDEVRHILSTAPANPFQDKNVFGMEPHSDSGISLIQHGTSHVGQ